ncbi:MAG: ECF transporter S component [Clostridia bacterium]|nr:ECF transporter S component [Clostridia bacterium]
MEIKKKFSTQKLVLTAIMTSLVIVFQVVGMFPVSTFAAAFALIPIIVGAILLGPYIGAWLGFIFSIVALLTPSTWGFLTIDPFATIVIVLLKGTACGYVSGLAYKLLTRVNEIFATFIAAFVCPVVNTGIFILGGIMFLTDDLAILTDGKYEGLNGAATWLWGLAAINFVLEFSLCVFIAPVIKKIIDIYKDRKYKKKHHKHHHHHHDEDADK